MSNKPLAYPLGIYISSAVLMVYALFIVWAYNYNYRLAKEYAESKAMLLNSTIATQVRERIISTQEIASNIVTQLPFYQQHDETRKFFLGILDKYPHIWSIRLHVDPSGKTASPLDFNITKTDPSKFSPANSTPYDNCLDNELRSGEKPWREEPHWSEPYQCGDNQHILSVYCLPFSQKDSVGKTILSGYVACQLSLNFLQGVIEKTKIGEKGYAFLVSSSGTYITHPKKEFILRQNIFNLPLKVFPGDSADLAENFMTGLKPVITFPIVLDYAKAWAYPTRIPVNGWVLAFVMPFSELYRDLNLLLLKMILVSIGVAALIFFLVFGISRRIMRPLSSISQELASFSIEKLDSEPGKGNETVSLQKSLAHLQKRYEKTRQSESDSSLRRAKHRADLQLASEIQQTFIPPQGNHKVPSTGITIHSVFRPLQMVSGDLYDFFMIDDTKLLIAIGDVSGGGFPAAIFMGIADTYIKSNAFAGSAKDIVSQVNMLLCKNNSNQFFLSLFLGILDIKEKTLNYCNAGQTPSFFISHAGKVKELGDPHGLPLGLYPDRSYKDTYIHMGKGDTLIMYTDGVTEQLNEAGEFFGVDNFYLLFDAMKEKTPEEIAGIIIGAVNDFAGATAQIDDLSLLVLQNS